MAFVLNDRVKETTTTTGTGTVNLGGAATGFETFVAGVGNSNSTYYCIAGQTTAEFEVGIGTVTDASPDTLSRTTILSSSNSDSAVDFSAGTKDVFCTLPAAKTIREFDTAVNIPTGTTAQRSGSAAAGDFRYNTSTGRFEGYSSAWNALGGSNTFSTDIFAGDGSDTTFTLSQSIENENDLFVFIDGVFQAHNSYSVSGTTLTFSTAPANSRVITAYSVKSAVSGNNVTISTMDGDGSDTTLTLAADPVNENNVQVYIDGVYQNKDTFAVSGTTLTFSEAPPNGSKVEAITLTQTNINTATQLSDADGDTLVQVEESSDEDTIRMDIAGTEVLTLTNSAMTLKGTTPTLTIGDAGAEDTKIVFDGNAQDYYVGLDDSADDLIIGLGSTVGTTPAISIDESRTVMISQYLTLKTTDDAANQWYLYTNTDDTFQLNYNGSGNAEVVVDTSGNVGIGTTSPDRKLHLNEAASSTSNFIHLTTADTGTTGSNGFLVGIGSDGAAELWNYEAQRISFATSSTERMRIDSSGLVGIGQTPSSSDGSMLQITGSDGIQLKRSGQTNGFVIRPNASTDGIRFTQGGTGDRMTIDASGNVGIGITTVAAELHVNETNAGGLGGRMLIQNNSSTSGSYCQLILAPTAATAADRCVVIQAENTDGNNNQAMVFKTSAGDSPAERVRIRPYGDLLVGTTSAAQNSSAGVKLNNDGGQGRCFVVGSGSGGEGFSLHDGSAYKFFVTYAGVINATTTTISGISDERLKENIKDLDQGLADILKLKPRTFDWKEGEGTGKKNVSGFIAQEAETAGFGEFVGDWKHDTLSDAKSFGQAGLIPALVKAIQEQQTLIETLQAKVEALENG